jgi:hypothetical protein
MKIDRVTVSVGKTVSSGIAYEFIRADAALSASVEPDEDRKKVRQMLRKECIAAVNGIIGKILEETHG